jgi:hypothetical protein
MSSGVIKNKFSHFFDIENQLVDLTKSSKSIVEKNKYNLLSDLMSILFKYKNNKDSFKYISNLINVSLISDKRHLSYNNTSNNFKEKYLLILKIIRSFLLNQQNLTNHQKSEYCSIERYFMKLYLKEFLEIL